MNLAEEQAAFWAMIVEPEAGGAAHNRCFSLVASSNAFDGRLGCEVYSNAYVARITNTAKEIYPILFYSLGEEAFQALWLRYLSASPPDDWCLRSIGKHLPSFMEQTKPYCDLPGLLALLELERHTIELFDWADEPSITPAAAMSYSPKNWVANQVTAKSDWRLLETEFDVVGYWRRAQVCVAHSEAPENSVRHQLIRLKSPQHVLIWRQHETINIRAINESAALVLAGMQTGKCLGELCDLLSNSYTVDRSTSIVVDALGLAIECELLSCK